MECWIARMASKRSFSSRRTRVRDLRARLGVSACGVAAKFSLFVFFTRECTIWPFECRERRPLESSLRLLMSKSRAVPDRSIVRNLWVSTRFFTTFSWLISPANLLMLSITRPSMMMPPTEYGKTSPRPTSLAGTRSPKPTVSMVTSQK